MNLWEEAEKAAQNEDVESYGDLTPKEIAEAIFHEMPKDARSLGIQLDSNIADNLMIFEILATITLEGLDILSEHNLHNFDFENFSENSINALNPWIRSLQFNIICTVHEKDNFEEYDDYYCKVFIRNPSTQTIFTIKGISEPYHFIINGSNYEANKNKKNLKDLSMVFFNNNKIYKISYDYYMN